LGLTGILADFNPLAPVVSVPLFRFPIGSWNITVSNHMFMVTVTGVLLLVWLPLAVWQKRLVPSGWPNLVEAVCVYLREQMARPLLQEHTDRYVGFVWTMFFFILSLNLLAMVPTEKIIYLVTGKENHFGGPATANIWITGAMACVTFLVTHISGIKQQGFLHYFAHFAPPAPWWATPLVYFMEVVSAFVKPFTLAIRLFANILGGHVLPATLIGLIAIFQSYLVAGSSVTMVVFLAFLDLLIAFIQAYIFAFLTVVYIGAALNPEH
jgi:F-type H+-transporting ATPase subunit a